MEKGQSRPQNVTTVSAVVLSRIPPENRTRWYNHVRPSDSLKLVRDQADSGISYRYHQDEPEARPSSSAAQPREVHYVFWSDVNTVCFTTGVSGIIRRTVRETVELSYSDCQVIGEGHSGIVYRAKLHSSGQLVAIKKMKRECERLIDGSGGIRFDSNELKHLRSLDHHVNVVQPKSYFFTVGEGDRMFMNLMMEYVPENLATVMTRYRVTTPEGRMPMFWVKLYMYQLFRGLGYIHSKCICHRSVRPQNILVNSESGVLKICDFGNAKFLIEGERNSVKLPFRHYRAPELLLQNEFYTTQIDVWSAGCVLAEVLLGYPIFAGSNSQDQLEKIIRVLGTPSVEQIQHMNPDKRVLQRFQSQQVIRAQQWGAVFPEDVKSTPGLIKLVSCLLDYSPFSRMPTLEACVHPFFNELSLPSTRLPNDRSLPPLFNFSVYEMTSRVPTSKYYVMCDLVSLRMWATGSSSISDDRRLTINHGQLRNEIEDLLFNLPPPSNPVEEKFRHGLVTLRELFKNLVSDSPPDLFD